MCPAARAAKWAEDMVPRRSGDSYPGAELTCILVILSTGEGPQMVPTRGPLVWVSQHHSCLTVTMTARASLLPAAMSILAVTCQWERQHSATVFMGSTREGSEYWFLDLPNHPRILSVLLLTAFPSLSVSPKCPSWTLHPRWCFQMNFSVMIGKHLGPR